MRIVYAASIALSFVLVGCSLPWDRFHAREENRGDGFDTGELPVDGSMADGTSDDGGHDDAADRDVLEPVRGVGTPTQLAAGDGFTCALNTLGQVFCWGSNEHGELGVADILQSSTPVHVPLTTSVQSIAAGRFHACAVTASGRVYCWGRNSSGELGRGSPSATGAPALALPGSVAYITAGDGFTCAELQADATNATHVECWGSNASGQIGSGSTSASPALAPVAVGTDLTHVTAGANHACAVRATDSVVVCWGSNSLGQTGTGSVMPSNCSTGTCVPAPMPIARGTGVPRAGVDVTCLLDATTGVTACWGSNASRQIDSSATAVIGTPTALPFAAPASDLAFGLGVTCLFTTTGVSCFGDGAHGELGAGDTRPSPLPAAVQLSSAATAVVSGRTHACALLLDHRVQCWGSNHEGQLGNGRAVYDPTPAPVRLVSGGTALMASHVDVGKTHACATLAGAAGGLYCWGSNELQQLGATDTPAFVDRPAPVPSLQDTTQIALGDGFTCVLGASRAVKCWGDNSSRQLATGTIAGHTATPFTVPLSNVTALVAGGAFACAVTGGVIECWGDDSLGQLGRGMAGGPVARPDAIAGSIAPVELAAGNAHVDVVASSGMVWSWGDNLHGDVNASGTSPAATPGSTAFQLTHIAAGEQFNCGLAAAGTMACWGRNDVGQLGNGMTSDVSVPLATRLVGQDVAQLALGMRHTCATTTSHEVWCWGDPTSGATAAASSAPQLTPIRVASDIDDAMSVVAGGRTTCVTRTNDELWCWGDDRFGQLGRGSRPIEATPVFAFP